jgi:hypothetical protein
MKFLVLLSLPGDDPKSFMISSFLDPKSLMIPSFSWSQVFYDLKPSTILSRARLSLPKLGAETRLRHPIFTSPTIGLVFLELQAAEFGDELKHVPAPPPLPLRCLGLDP